VRHTEVDNPKNIYTFRLPLPLSEKGKEHAKRIGKWFLGNGLLKLPIYSSPIARCVQTAQIIANEIQSSVTTDENLTESSCPNLQGKKQPLVDSWKVGEGDKTRESRQSVLSRVLASFNEKVEERKDCILVSHGDSLTLLYYQVIGKKPPRYFWGPNANTPRVVRQGEIFDLELNGQSPISIKRVQL
jgi:broad specificity phosphatase PhoE